MEPMQSHDRQLRNSGYVDRILWIVVAVMAISPISLICVWILGPVPFFDGQGFVVLFPFLPGLLLSPVVLIASMILAFVQAKADRPAHCVAFWLVCLTTLPGVTFFSLVELGVAWSNGKASGHFW